MKIYTRKGDQGQTRLVGGCLVSKTDERIEGYGSVDELCSQVGVLIEHLKLAQVANCPSSHLTQIQNELFCIGSLMACEDLELHKKLPHIPSNAVERLENKIDELSSELPELKNFILPGGSLLSAEAHRTRTSCRRAERNAVKLYQKHPENEPLVHYLNRLSDYFFVLARWLNHTQGIADRIWEKP